ncbi:MAG: histidine phosphatase family protein [Deltaproteobacteria bacterium]|nr:histidine phosphatase family protein [Deltaproteobacteria bacterium]
MSKTLFLLRHAKPVDPGRMDDFDRPLTSHGVAQAAALGKKMAADGLVPQVILASPAARAAATANDVAAQLVQAGKFSGQVTTEPRIYNAYEDDLLDVVREIPDGIQRALLVGHMPGMGELARLLAARREGHSFSLQTCALVVLEQGPESWTQVGRDSFQQVNILPPLA